METFYSLLAICAGNSSHKGQWRGALMFSLICVWINGWVNSREAGDLRRYRAHYDVTVMSAVYQYRNQGERLNITVVLFIDAQLQQRFSQIIHYRYNKSK